MDAPPPSEAIYATSHFMIESILRWPVFAELYPDIVMHTKKPTIELLGQCERTQALKSQSSTLLEVDAAVLERLIEAFLDYNFVKNPVLDIDILRREAASVAENGLRWDGGSCLVVSYPDFLPLLGSTLLTLSKRSTNSLHSYWYAR
jgi:hypothetical protein